MASVKVSKLRILGLKTDREAILHVLERSPGFEICPTTDFELGEKKKDPARVNTAKAKQAKISFAIDYLQALNDEVADRIVLDGKNSHTPGYHPADFIIAPIKTGKSRKIIGYETFYNISSKEYELLCYASDLKQISEKRQEIKAQTVKHQSFAHELEIFGQVAAPEPSEPRATIFVIAKGNSAMNPLKGIDVYSESYAHDDGTIIGILAKKDNIAAVTDALENAEFVKYNISEDEGATLKLLAEKNAEQIHKDDQSDVSLINQALVCMKYLGELKILYDVVGFEIDRANADLEFVKTDTTFVLEGWAASSHTQEIIRLVNEKAPLSIAEIIKPEKGERPPTILKNNKIVKPFESITDMYSPPAYGEFDPNGIMSFFFFVIFGLMLGDAGYGMILSLGCFVILRHFKLEKGTRSLITVFGICGLSAIIWGILLGGVFAIPSIPAILFNPLEEPIKMLILSLIIGGVHVLAGYAINAYKKIRSGKVLDGILDNVFYFILLGGVSLLGLSLILEPSTLPLGAIGMIMLFGAILMLVLTAGRHNQGIGGKIGGGFMAIYDLLNLFSNILSYFRIFGLLLASAAIGLAFNTIGAMFFGSVFGYIIGGLLLVVMHAFNMAIGLMGAYINDMRLQYLEFFGRFYEGGGRPFEPMGEKTRYVRFN